MKDYLISREAAISAAKHAWAKGLEPSQYIEIIPSVHAVPLDKLYELFQETGAQVPCGICSKIMPEWCKKNNNLPLSCGEEWKCPSLKQLLTKWMEEQDANRE